jgi:molybdopterin-binding protein
MAKHIKLTFNPAFTILTIKFNYKGKPMKLSARNMIKGKVSKITLGAVNAEVELELADGQKIVSIITIDSVKRLGLETGKTAYAMIKASSVMIAVD